MDKHEVVVGRIGRAHGIKGEVSVELRTDEPERRFAEGSVLRAARLNGNDAQQLRVRRTRWHQDRLLVTFEGLPDRTAAEAAKGLLLHVVVDRSERPEDPDEFYDHQIVGLTAVTTEGAVIGTVSEVSHNGGQDLLVIATGTGDVLVPFVTALVPEVDLESGRLTVADRPGLLTPLEDD